MALVTPDIYRRHTRDYEPEGGDINDAVAIAEEMLEEVLNRKLEQVAVTNETVIARKNNVGTFVVFPQYMPVTSVSTVGWSIHQDGYLQSVPGGFSLVWNLDQYHETNRFTTTVSYTGGWTTVTAPTGLLMAISKLAQNVLYQGGSGGSDEIPAGIKSASMGSLSIDVGDDGASSQGSLITNEVLQLARRFRRER